MTQKSTFSRRNFFKAAGATAAATLMTAFDSRADTPLEAGSMPTRPFGNTGVEVPILSFGGSVSMPQIMLGQAFKWGATYWDTANSYMGGDSENRIGKYLARYPQHRKQLFLVTKSHAWTLRGMGADLDESLERMRTDYVDLFLVHSVSGIDELDNAKKAWSEKKKAEGKFRLFGFSTHRNMEACMMGAARLGWIDGIMMSYNFRLMHTDGMKRAVDACSRAGIGLTAMKTQGGGALKTTTETEGRLVERLLQKGFTQGQAKLKAVWEDPNIASICSEMPNMSILMENVSASLNRTRLSKGDKQLLQCYADETRADYCSGCTRICEPALNSAAPIGDIMRALMYWRSYGDYRRAARHIHRISADCRMKLAALDFAPAERMCPRQMAIGRLVRTALAEFDA
ncbi:Ferredoxin [Olavius algarvensis associated proteobacterium Delta 3]|nr:Ferredoxin [Olavius algarvensis associated proteobacterium Delta 3]CAB5118587.1 Ferredoxin [Olavius algarvensis associated proteobacterium Delta 3]